MVYILGFIVADGCIFVKRTRKRDGGKQYVLDITSKDYSLLEGIKKVMMAGQKIGVKYGSYTGGRSFHIQIGHQEICKDLLSLGVMPRKTYNLKPMEISKQYFPDFSRGFFDGDGSVYIYLVNNTPQIKASICSASRPFLQDFNRRVCGELKIPVKSLHEDRSNESGIAKYYIDFYIDDCEKLYEFMYGNNPSLYLLRKRKIFEKWGTIKRRRYIKKDYPSKVRWHLNQKVSVSDCEAVCPSDR